MSAPILTPIQNASVSVLPETGSAANVPDALPIDLYSSDPDFLSGAVAQVKYVYRHLSGDILDIELVEDQVYAAYQDAVLEWGYLINMHQARNVLLRMLGLPTGSFQHTGQLESGSDIQSNLSLKYPKYSFDFARRVSTGLAAESGFGGQGPTIYSASVPIETAQQDYDLQAAVMNNPELSGAVGTKKVLIHRVYYRSAASTWRFYGYYGGLNVVGNLSTYGQYADDAVFEVIPTWQNKLQAMAFEDSLWTRTSHYSYKLENNRIRIYPVPSQLTPLKIWFEFSIPGGIYDSESIDTVSGSVPLDNGISGVANGSNIPFENIPFASINAIGQQWIRRWALAICKCMLAQSRGKTTDVPIMNERVTLNWAQLEAQCEKDKEILREELKEWLDQILYKNLMADEQEIVDSTQNIQAKIPLLIYRV